MYLAVSLCCEGFSIFRVFQGVEISAYRARLGGRARSRLVGSDLRTCQRFWSDYGQLGSNSALSLRGPTPRRDFRLETVGLFFNLSGDGSCVGGASDGGNNYLEQGAGVGVGQTEFSAEFFDSLFHSSDTNADAAG